MLITSELLELAVKAAYEGALEILDVYGTKFDVALKSDNSPLTQADQRAHNKIMSYLVESGIPVLSEEGADIPYEMRSKWDLFWMVDPLDGTKEFVKRNGEFTVNIALIRKGEPIMGVILVPVTGDLYFASKEEGAFKMEGFNTPNGSLREWKKSAQKLPYSSEVRPFTIVSSRSHMSEETSNYVAELKAKHGEIQFVSMGSSLKICLIAEGAADIYPRFAPTMEWDTAAGHAIANAAGKEIIDFTTKVPMRYNKENLLNNWFVVS
jgi:3'(2'), 5'-bisphosphate nucleotidase